MQLLHEIPTISPFTHSIRKNPIRMLCVRASGVLLQGGMSMATRSAIGYAYTGGMMLIHLLAGGEFGKKRSEHN